jgi:hypothetical protein
MFMGILSIAAALITALLAPMTVTGKIYGLFFTALANEEHDLLSDTLKCMLTTSSYTPDQDTHDYKNDVSNEVSGTGYSAGGATLGSVSINYNTSTNKWVLDCADPSWTSSTITARCAVFYNSTGGGADSSRGLICYQLSDGDISTTNGTFTVQINASGLVEITVA